MTVFNKYVFGLVFLLLFGLTANAHATSPNVIGCNVEGTITEIEFVADNPSDPYSFISHLNLKLKLSKAEPFEHADKTFCSSGLNKEIKLVISVPNIDLYPDLANNALSLRKDFLISGVLFTQVGGKITQDYGSRFSEFKILDSKGQKIEPIKQKERPVTETDKKRSEELFNKLLNNDKEQSEIGKLFEELIKGNKSKSESEEIVKKIFQVNNLQLDNKTKSNYKSIALTILGLGIIFFIIFRITHY